MEKRRKELIDATRELYEEKGIAQTTVKDITERCNVTRTLFYHYFDSKEAITSAVLDDYINDFTEAVRLWNESRVYGDVKGALRNCIKLIRRVLFDSNYFRKMLATRENAGLYLEFMTRASEALSQYVVETTVKDYQAHHEIEIEHVPETFNILIIGLAGYLRTNPEVDDEMLVEIVAQTLRLDM